MDFYIALSICGIAFFSYKAGMEVCKFAGPLAKRLTSIALFVLIVVMACFLMFFNSSPLANLDHTRLVVGAVLLFAGSGSFGMLTYSHRNRL